jgi:hypothetical protein
MTVIVTCSGAAGGTAVAGASTAGASVAGAEVGAAAPPQAASSSETMSSVPDKAKILFLVIISFLLFYFELTWIFLKGF